MDPSLSVHFHLRHSVIHASMLVTKNISPHQTACRACPGHGWCSRRSFSCRMMQLPGEKANLVSTMKETITKADFTNLRKRQVFIHKRASSFMSAIRFPAEYGAMMAKSVVLDIVLHQRRSALSATTIWLFCASNTAAQCWNLSANSDFSDSTASEAVMLIKINKPACHQKFM